MAESNTTTSTPKRITSQRIGGLSLKGRESTKANSITPKMGAFTWMPLISTTDKLYSSAPRYVAPALRSPSKDRDSSDSKDRSRSRSNSSDSNSSKSGNWRSKGPLPTTIFTKPGHVLYLPELAFIKPGSCVRKQFRESDNEGACNHPIVPLRAFTNPNGENLLEFMTCTSFGGLGPVAGTPDWMKRSARLIEHAGATAYDRQAPLELEFGSDSFEKPTYVLTGIKYVIELDQVRPYKPSAGTITLSAASISHIQKLAE